MALRIFPCVMAVVLLAGCSYPGNPREKCTASLLKAMTAKYDTAMRYHVVAVLSKSIERPMEEQVRALGMDPVSPHPTILKAVGTPLQIDALASLDWVERLDMDPEYKFDAALRAYIARAKRENDIQLFRVLGRCARPVSDEIRKDLEQTGARILNVIGDVFTAELTLPVLYHLAGLEVVILLQLTQTGSFQ
ncbi:MAG: hypothetical protein QHI48_09635 [Bacteroidota bacterium]|nr:hypothetical protein [Bacteroidota bacterium]